MTYLHPLAYLLGIEGIALLRSFAGDFDREFVQDHGADPHLHEDEGTGFAPLEWAVRGVHSDTADLLRSAGGRP